MTDRGHLAAQEPVTYANTRDALVDALVEFDREALLSLLRPGRLAEWKRRFNDLRIRLEMLGG